MNQTLSVQSLSKEAFQKYGEYVHLDQVSPDTFQLIGQPPVEFYPDLITQNIGKPILGISLLRVYPRAYEIEFSEHHHDTEECLLPLDGDVFMHVGGAPQSADGLAVEIFEVPKLTLVRLKIGVWHHAVFSRGNDPVNVLILLTERTYHNDCEVLEYRKGFSCS